MKSRRNILLAIFTLSCLIGFTFICFSVTLADIKNLGSSPIAERILGLKTFTDGIYIKDANTATIDPNGKITGKELNLNSGKFSVDPNGSITAAADTDTTFTFGRGKMGYDGTNNDYFVIGHYDNFDPNNYALLQKNTGSTFLNAKTAGSINFCINNVGYSYMNSTSWYLHALNIQNSGASISYEGSSAHSFLINRNSVTNTAGNALTIQSGGCTASATDKNGGNLLLKSGISTGTGTSQIDFYTATAGTTGTTDNTPSLKLSLNSNGDLIPGIDNNSYIGKNDDDTPFAYKGVILKDQAGTGKYYRLEVYNDALRIVDLTD